MFRATATATTIATMLSIPALAHVPVFDIDAKTIQAPFVIEDAQHSKAIYAKLDGDADIYKIQEAEPFDFYVGITVPKPEGCARQSGFSFDVLDADMKVIDQRRASDSDWQPWFEEFGKRWYWVGPQIGEDFASLSVYPAGTYYIRVFNDTNQGKYVLAVGDDEKFGLGTLLTIRKTVRAIDPVFWNEQDCP